MKKIFLVFFNLMFLMGAGCGSSSSGNEDDLVVTNPDYALISYNNTTVIDTENSELTCDSAGDNCYGFSMGFDEEALSDKTIISLAVTQSSGHSFTLYFDSGLTTGREYEHQDQADFMDQDLRFYASYASPDIQCDDNCSNVYNYSDTVTCRSDLGSCKYYKIYIRENSEESLDFDFYIWNNYFLEGSEGADDSTAGRFTGRIIIDKTEHLTDAELLYPREATE